MKQYRKTTLADGRTQRVKTDLASPLNLGFVRLTNLTHATGEHDLPALSCNTEVFPDYIALSGYPAQFYETPLTAVGFWEYDVKFDGYDGLYNAIYHDNHKRLDYFKKRFAGVRIFFTPDYSQFGDICDIENNYRLFRARIVGIWFAVELGAVVIPFITAPTMKDMPLALDGLEDCSVVAFSTKGYVNNAHERAVLKEMVRLTIDRLRLKAIVVYDVCATNDAVDGIFAYAKDKGVRIVVPSNALKRRNIARREERLAKQ